MILGIGTDLVENQRLERWLEQPRLLSKYFTEKELDDARTGSHPAASLAARFAAKEAFGKALGTGMRGLALRDIETRRGGGGKPDLFLTGTARLALDARGARAHLSLTHERDYALAFVVLEAP
jgi:holo-[acyl-carrier protein] synthase